MSELTLTLIKLGFLALLWMFVLAALSVIRSDLFGAKVDSRPTATAIVQANNLSAGHKIQVGEKLIIPVTPGRGAAVIVAVDGSRVRYIVRRGETLASVAREFDVTIAQIRKWNKMGANSNLRPGRALVIYTSEPLAQPGHSGNSAKQVALNNSSMTKRKQLRVTHQVKKGDTLFAIATNYKTTVDSIRGWNNLPQNMSLKVGDRLTIYVNR